MWALYCGGRSDGVVVEATLGALRRSIQPGFELKQVSYGSLSTYEVSDDIVRYGTWKRQMFEYERELRIIWGAIVPFGQSPLDDSSVRLMPWDAEKVITSIRSHPLAEMSFHETLETVVRTFSPELQDRVRYSDMRQSPESVFRPLDTA